MLTRSIGVSEDVDVDLVEVPLVTDDLVLLCSDGLTKMVTEEEMAKVLAASATGLEAVDTLISMANAAGGVDNVTVAVAKSPAAPKSGWRSAVSRFFGG